MKPMRLLLQIVLLFALAIPFAPGWADTTPEAELQRLIDQASEDLAKDKDLLGKVNADMKETSQNFGQFNDMEAKINEIMKKCKTIDINNRMKMVLKTDVTLVTSAFVSKNALAGGVTGALKDFFKKLGKDLASHEAKEYIDKHWPGIWSDGSRAHVGQIVESSLREVEEFNIALQMNYMAMDAWVRRTTPALAGKESLIDGDVLIMRHSQLIEQKGDTAVAVLGRLKAAYLAQHKSLAALKGAVESDIRKLEADIKAWDRQLRLMGIVRQANEWARMPDPVTFPANPSYDFGSAAAMMREAWQKLAAGEYTCNSYYGAQSNAISGAQAKMSEILKPYADNAMATCASGRGDACSAAWDRYYQASTNLWNAYKAEVQGTQQKLYEDAKAVANGPFAQFAADLYQWDMKEVELNVWGQDYMQKMDGQRGEWLATAIWRFALNASAGGTDFAFPIYPPTVSRIAESQKRLEAWQEDSRNYRDLIRKRFDDARSASATVAGYASGATSLGDRLRPNIELWECFRSYVTNYTPAINHLNSLRYQAERLSRFEAPFNAITQEGEAAGRQLMVATDQSLDKTIRVANILNAVPATWQQADRYRLAVRELYAASHNNLDASGDQIFTMLSHYNINEGGLHSLEQRVQKLSNPAALEAEARTQIPGMPEYNQKLQVLPADTLLSLKKVVIQRLASIGESRERYTKAFEATQQAEKSLSASLEATRRELDPVMPAVAAGFYVDDVMASFTESDDRIAYGMRNQLGSPRDLPESGLGSGPLLDKYARLSDRYYQLISPVLPYVRAERYAPAMEEVLKNLLANVGRLQGLPSGVFGSELDKYNHEAYQLVQRANNEGKVDPKGKLAQAYGAIISKVGALSSEYYAKQRIVQAATELRDLINGINAFLSNPDAMGGWSTAQQWQDSIGYTRSSVEGGPAKNDPGVRSLLSQLDGLMTKLKTVASNVDAATLQRDTQVIQAMYREFAAAYQSKNLRGVMRFLAETWRTADGSEAFDMEDTLSNSFRLFDQISFKINNLRIRRVDRNYEVSYQASIVGKINRLQKTHDETSNVVDTVTITPDGPRITRTSGATFWGK